MSFNPLVPRGKSVGSVSFGFGRKKSTARLRELDFDPIKNLVDTYKEVEAEVEYQRKMRTGEIVELSTTGKPRAYRAEVHHALLDKKIAIGDKLMRYAYGRVPENEEESKPSPPALVVQLTKEGETYVINESQNPSEDVESDDDNW